MSMPPETCWWWIRHAPAEKVDGRFAPKDAPLAPIGESAFLGLRAELSEPALWIASPLLRATQTCEYLKGDGDFLLEPELAEQNFGAWEGRSYDEIWQETKDQPEWNTPAQLTPPSGESFADVMARVEKAIIRLTTEHAGRNIICVSHSGVIRAAVGMAGKLSAEQALAFEVPHLSLIQIRHSPEGWKVGRLQASAA